MGIRGRLTATGLALLTLSACATNEALTAPVEAESGTVPIYRRADVDRDPMASKDRSSDYREIYSPPPPPDAVPQRPLPPAPARPPAPVASASPASGLELPVLAKPGECYARVVIPARFDTTSERVLKSPQSDRIEIEPARYEWVEQRVMVKPESERIIEVAPAQYRWTEDRVLVTPAGETVEEVPARFHWVEEREMVKPATQVWKPGRGLIEKVNDATGEIMCLVEVPAEYRTIRKKVIDAPATTRRTATAAEYKTVRRQELVKPAEIRRETIPAQYETVRVRKLVSAAQERRIVIPAEYETVERQVEVASSRLEWRSVLCETNATADTIRDLQRALANAGYSPGKIDGKLGPATMSAVRAYQNSVGLAQGGVTSETLDRLGVSR